MGTSGAELLVQFQKLGCANRCSCGCGARPASSSAATRPTKAAEIKQWLNRVCDTFNMPNGWPRLPLLGPLMHRKSNTHYKDAMIAAIAKVHQLRVVTPNLSDFSRFYVPLLNPFSDGLTPR